MGDRVQRPARTQDIAITHAPSGYCLATERDQPNRAPPSEATTLGCIVARRIPFPLQPLRMRLTPIASALILLLASCGDDRGSSNSVVRDQRGDTLVLAIRGKGTWGGAARLAPVATFGEAEGSDTVILGRIIALAAAPDGRLVATDAQRLAVRVFDAALRPLALWGREGSGPAELRNPDGGLAVLSDGRVAVRDPGNARMQIFSSAGASGGEWRVVDAGLRTRDNFGLQGDTLLSRVVVMAEGPIDRWRYGLARIAPNGMVLDTVMLPTAGAARPTLVARRGNNTAELPLPFSASALSTWHPSGGFATADGDRYAITWPQSGGMVRVERDVQPVAVSDAEAAQERAYVTKGLQWLDPTWTWTGPDLPRTKPLISQLFVGTDGSVWAVREGEAVDGDDPDFTPNDASSVERRLKSRLSFDVFTASGEYLGALDLPPGMQLRPQPVFTTTGLTALTLDDIGVPRLVRYRVETPAAR